MTFTTIVIALAGLILALRANSRAKQAVERADDSLRYLADLKNRAGSDFHELFREINRVSVRQKRAAGLIKRLPYEITDACIACGACEPECPEEAIRPGEIYRIIPDLCNACKKCVKICPVEACVEMAID